MESEEKRKDSVRGKGGVKGMRKREGAKKNNTSSSRTVGRHNRKELKKGVVGAAVRGKGKSWKKITGGDRIHVRSLGEASQNGVVY